MSIKKIHHINFVVSDLTRGMEQYKKLLGVSGFIVDDLPGRGVKTARVKVGEQWLVLVEPVDMDGVPGKHLQEHGEGFFLISYSVDNLKEAAQTVIDNGSEMTSDQPRQGLENWQVWDIRAEDTFGAQIQLCEEQSQLPIKHKK